jgi:3-hydroxyacyl-CoA dehydrogenase / enoyl-CoA hydratase / 3-hydroxybutyryl-CoA epimerase
VNARTVHVPAQSVPPRSGRRAATPGWAQEGDLTASVVTGVVRWEQDESGVVLLTLDNPARSANTMGAAYTRAMQTVVDNLQRRKHLLSGVIITSTKQTFAVGGDLDELLAAGPHDAEDLFLNGLQIKDQLRQLETLGVPVVAALNGSAVGGGLEIALACHRRIAVNDPAARFGLPEVTLGLMSAAGGVVRAVRMFGVVQAGTALLLQGQTYRPQEALELGIIDELVDSHAELVAAARRWIGSRPQAVQPWDRPGYMIPGGTPASPEFASILPGLPAALSAQLNGAPYQAPQHILAAAVEGTQVDIETAGRIEARYSADLATSAVAKNLITAFFARRVSATPDAALTWPASSPEPALPVQPVRSVAILGAGMMGSGIALSCARAGLDVVVKDVDDEYAARAVIHAERMLSSRVARGRMTPEARDEVLGRIRTVTDITELSGCDLVIETVFEDPALKQTVLSEAAAVLAPGALIASGTSTLPITDLASSAVLGEDFLGLHFLSPVDRMPLVEVVRGASTSDAAVRRAVALVQRLGKTAIVVNDSRGFFTSRVIGTFTGEALIMLAEGISPASIEQASKQAGYPMPVLALIDDLTLTLPRTIRQQAMEVARAAGEDWSDPQVDTVLDRMIDEFDRPGRSGGAGFYEYEEGRRVRLWPGLYEHFMDGPAGPPGRVPPGGVPFEDLKERLLFIEAIEAVKCLQEGVIRSVADGDVASLLGIGFPGWTGGVLRFINQYESGVAGFTLRAQELARSYGERFTPPDLLRAVAASGGSLE